MVRLIFTGSQLKKDAKFFISVPAHPGGWGVGSAASIYPIFLHDASSMQTSSHALFVLQFNCAPTEGNYLQVFLDAAADFCGLRVSAV